MPSPALLRIALADNSALLSQGAQLVGKLSPVLYSRKNDFCYGSSVGGHYRHTLDHYFSFLAGCSTGVVDYESRERDPLLETEPGYAAKTTATLLSALAALSPETLQRPLRLRSEFGQQMAGADDPCAVTSSLRELEFLLSHTVHHFALIGTICGVLQVPVTENFGVAPSTLRHRRALARHEAEAAARA